MWDLFYTAVVLLIIWIILHFVKSEEHKNEGTSEIFQEKVGSSYYSEPCAEGLKREDQETEEKEESQPEENEEFRNGLLRGNILEDIREETEGGVLKGEDIDRICDMLMKSSFSEEDDVRLNRKNVAVKEPPVVKNDAETVTISSKEDSINDFPYFNQGIGNNDAKNTSKEVVSSRGGRLTKGTHVTDQSTEESDVSVGKDIETSSGIVTFEDSDNENDDSLQRAKANESLVQEKVFPKCAQEPQQAELEITELPEGQEGQSTSILSRLNTENLNKGEIQAGKSSVTSIKESKSETFSSSEQVTSTVITKVVNVSYTTEELSSESVDIKLIDGGPELNFDSFGDSPRQNKMEVLKEFKKSFQARGEATDGTSSIIVEGSKSENILTDGNKTGQSVESEPEQDGGAEFQKKKPACGVFLFGGEELLSKIKERRVKIEEGEQTTEEVKASSSSSVSNTRTTFTNQTKKESSSTITETNNQSETHFTERTNRQTFSVDAFKQSNFKTDNTITLSGDTFSRTDDPLCAPPAISRPFSDSNHEVTSFSTSDDQIGMGIPLPDSQPLIHMNKDRPKGPLRRRIITIANTEG